MVGRERPAEKREVGIAVADVEIAEHLIVGSVLLDDEHDVLHVRPDLRHPRIRRSPSGSL